MSTFALAFLPPYAPDLNPVEYLWAWLKRHALVNFCAANLAEFKASNGNVVRSLFMEISMETNSASYGLDLSRLV